MTVGTDSYTNQYGTTFVMTFAIEDWIADDGATLLSTVDPARAAADAAAPRPSGRSDRSDRRGRRRRGAPAS